MSHANTPASGSSSAAPTQSVKVPLIPDHTLLRKIGEGSYGQVWLGRSVTEAYRAVKVVFRKAEDEGRAFERAYKGILNYEPISRQHDSLMDILQVGRNDTQGYFYYVMELADHFNAECGVRSAEPSERGVQNAECRIQVRSAEPSECGVQNAECGIGEASEGKAGAFNPKPGTGNAEQGTKQIIDHNSEIIDPDTYVPHTLKLQLRRHGCLPLRQCCRLGLALTSALEQLHERHLTHRDVKPSNIIFVNGQPKLADIDLVTRTDDTLSLVGTPGYTPPDGAGTPHADLYSLGKALYEACTAKNLDEFPEPATALEKDQIEDWAELNEIILKACAPSPPNRYASAAAMYQDLKRLAEGASIRRLRQAERWLAAAKKIAAIAVILSVLAFLGFLYQRYEARRFQHVAQESQARLRQLHVANGIRAMDEGDLTKSLVWFTEALRLTPTSQAVNQRGPIGGATNAAQTVTEEILQRRRWEAIWRQCPRLVGLGLHEGAIASAQFSPDGRMALTASVDQAACLWDLADDRLIWRLPHEQPLTYATFSHDGRRVVTCCEDGNARVWEVANGRLSYPPLPHDGKVLHAAFSPDGRRLVTCGADATARLWEADSGRLVCVLFKTTGEVNYAEFSQDGHWLVTASDDCTARLWDSLDGKAAGPPMRHPDHVRQARFSLDGVRVVTASRDGYARIFERQTGRLLSSPLKHNTPLLYALFSHDGRKVLCGGGGDKDYGEARVWDASTGQPITRSLILEGRSRAGAISPDDRIVATACQDHTVRLWDLETGRQIVPPLRHNHAAWDVNFSPGGSEVLTASRDGVWRVWELASGAELDRVHYYLNAVLHAGFASDNRHVALFGFPKDVSLWDPLSDDCRLLGEDPSSLNRGFGLSPQGRYLLIYDSGKTVLHDASTGATLRNLPLPATLSGPLTFNSDESLLLTCQDHVAQLWTISQGARVGTFPGHEAGIYHVAFSPDGRLAATSSSLSDDDPDPGTVRVWSVATGKLTCPPIQVDGAPVRAAFSLDGTAILIGSKDRTTKPHFAQLYDTKSGQSIGPRLWHSDGVNWVCFTPDGSRIVTGSEDGVGRIWSAKTGQPAAPALNHQQSITRIAFAPDGQRMVTASGDGTARIWDSISGEPLSPPLRHQGVVNCAFFSADGDRLVTGSDDKTCRIWLLPSTKLPIGDMQRMAMLMSGLRIDDTGGLSPLAPAELAELWKYLRASCPSEFSTKSTNQITWHRLQAAACEAVQNWRAAAFHLDRMLRYLPNDEELKTRRSKVEANLAATVVSGN